jgi:hypothetical protein
MLPGAIALYQSRAIAFQIGIVALQMAAIAFQTGAIAFQIGIVALQMAAIAV